jgi:hypothetical protein
VRSDGIGVLLLDEAAARLGVSRRELAAMLAAKKIEALACCWTTVIPTREVDRSTRGQPEG